jgi:hypothetical protein
MTGIVLIVLVVWIVLSVLLSAWSLWFQSYIYSEPLSQVYWRGPAAGTAVTVLMAVWIFFDYRAPGRYPPLHDFSGSTTKSYRELRIPNDRGQDVLYTRRQTAQGERYLNADNRELPARPRKVKVKDPDTDEEHVFEPELDARGRFKVEGNNPLHYQRDDKKEVMDERYLGTITTYHGGWLFVDLLLNFLLLTGCWVSLWLLLQFQWAHALGQAIVLWAVLILFVMPPILKRAETTAQERGVTAAGLRQPQRMCMMSPSWTM